MLMVKRRGRGGQPAFTDAELDRRVQAMCARARQSPVAVRIVDSQQNIAQYHHRTDTVVLGRKQLGTTDAYTIDSVIAHELGHRAERDRMRVLTNRSLAVAGVGMLLIAVGAVVVPVTGFSDAGTAWFGAFAVAGVALLWGAFMACWPSEYRADDYAADLLDGPATTLAALNVREQRNRLPEVPTTHPSRRARIRRQQRRAAIC